MSPLRDINTCIRATSDGALTTSALSGAMELEGTPMRGLALKITCTSASGTSPHLAVYVHASTSTTAPTSDSKIIAEVTALHPAAGGTSDPYVSYILPFVDPDARSIKVKLDTSGTSPNFDGVEVYVIPNVGMAWDRQVRFH